MSILHVTTSYIPKVRYGGPIYTIRSLARTLVQEGHRMVVYTTNVKVDQRTKSPLADPIHWKGMGEIGRAVARDKFCWSPSRRKWKRPIGASSRKWHPIEIES
jgi:hypothetical protein